MITKEAALKLDFPLGHLVYAILTLSILSLTIIPLSLAGETKAPLSGGHQEQPSVRAVVHPEAEESMEQALQAQASATSVDFLMNGSPTLSKPSKSQEVPSGDAEDMAEPPQEPQINAPSDTKAAQENPDEVAMLVSEQCSAGDGMSGGTQSCERIYSNGHHATLVTQNANEGDESKSQTVIEEFDGDGTLLFRKTIRHRVDYNYLNDQKAKEKELFDITYQPAGKKATRELMVYEYFLDTGKTRSLSWTQYKQISGELRAELVYNAVLRYGSDGTPDRGIAEQWNKGEIAETYLNWNRHSDNYATLDPEVWQQWEGWIRNVSLQAYLP